MLTVDVVDHDHLPVEMDYTAVDIITGGINVLAYCPKSHESYRLTVCDCLPSAFLPLFRPHLSLLCLLPHGGVESLPAVPTLSSHGCP